MKQLSLPSLVSRNSGPAKRPPLFGLLAVSICGLASATPPTVVDLSLYVRTARYNLPEPTRTTAPANSLLCQEASAVTYNWDTNTLFVVGDGGTSVVQISKTGVLIDSMTLAQGSSPQGTEFYDTEGITYVGGGQFVLTEERYRQANRFTYVAGGTLTRANAQTVKLGTTIGNVGIEGLCYDSQTSGFIFVKEKDPQSIFQTGINFTTLTATNGSPTATSSTDLFSPALANLADFSDVFSLSNIPSLLAPDSGQLLVLSQESGQIVKIARDGTVSSRLTLTTDVTDTLAIPDMTIEGLTVDNDGKLYVVNENGGGSSLFPQLWVYEPSTAPNLAPTAVALTNTVTSIPENTSTAAAIKVGDIAVTDDGLGANGLAVIGTDASFFQIIGSALYLKSGTVLSQTSKPSYSVSVTVDDLTVGSTPDATSATFTLNVAAPTSGTASLVISEVAPWSSGNSPAALFVDWFEVTNIGTATANISNWRIDDSAPTFATSALLNGITSIAPGESVIFMETTNALLATKKAAFLSLWFGANPPANLQFGNYTGSGLGLSTGGDAVNLFDATPSPGNIVSSVTFGSNAVSPYRTFDNAAGLNATTISTLSSVGINGVFSAVNDVLEIGSPGTIGGPSTPIITITATDASAAETASDPGTFRISRSGSTIGNQSVNYTIATGIGQAVAADYTPALTGVATIPSGQSFVDVTITPVDDALLEGAETITLTLGDTGSYDVGSPASATVTIADNEVNNPPSAVALSNTVSAISDTASTASAIKVADISVTDSDGLGTNTLSLAGADASSFQITGSALFLKAGTSLNYSTKPSYSVTVNVDDTTVGITPDASVNFSLAVIPGSLVITEVHPSGSSSAYAADWFEVTNNGTADVNITGWQMDDNSNGTLKVALRGVTTIPAGRSVIFFEGNATGTNDASIAAAFSTAWFGASPPAGIILAAYGGSGVGLSGGGDAVNIFDAAGNRVTGVAFGAATATATFDNRTLGLGSTTLPLPTISTLSVAGTNGAFLAAGGTETGSPGVSSNAPIGSSTVSIASASAVEGNSGTSTLNLPVTRSNVSSAFTVNYAVTGGTATSGSDFTLASGTLSFGVNGAATQNIAITINGDTTIESSETVIVTLSNTVNSNGSTTLGTAAGTGTITNDDTVPVSFPSNGKIAASVKGFIDLDAAPLASTNGAEIPAFDPVSKRAFTSSNSGIQVINLTNPAAPAFITTIVPSSLGIVGLTSNDVSSITVRKGAGGNPSVLAAAIIANPKTSPGTVVFLNAATGALIGSTTVGVVPDHIAFTPDGTKLLVCNEGELSTPEVTLAAAVPDLAQGTVSIVPVNPAGVPAAVQTADFTAFDAQTAALKTAGVRIFDDGVPSTDFEPEYLAISPDGTKALVTLQEANAVATLDIATATFTSVVPLGKKNFAAGRHDFSDRDGFTIAGAAGILTNPTTGNPVYGLYMPDAVAAYSAAGQTYYVTSNEGDDRNDFIAPDESTTVGNAAYDLDDTVFPNELALKNQASLGRLVVSNAPGLRGDTDGDGDIDEILSYGGRSFSILDSAGNIIWDSGDMIENIVASQFPANFDDGRSDNKGPEPEGVTIATLGARTYAFIGLERSHMTLMFDVTNPAAVTFAGGLVRSGDLNPEGLVVVSAADSPTGKPLLLQASEVSQTLTVFELNQTTDFTLQVLHYYGESGLLGIQTAPIMGAMIDKFDDLYTNTVVIGEGDSYIPGPWLIAGADPSLNAVPGIGSTALGRPDIAIMNAFGTDASALGNHEFDLGSPVLSGAFLAASPWVGAQFPFITANLNFAADSSLRGAADSTLNNNFNANNFRGQEVSAIKAKIAPYAVQTISGQKIGFVGATNWDLLTKTSPNGTVPKDDANNATSDLQEVAAYLQGAVNSLQALGVTKIIQVDQLDDLQRNKDLAPLVSGIDIVVAGGGHERMGDSTDVPVGFNGHDANFVADAYPITTAGADGRPVLIVTTDTEYTYLGRLVADFDADGVLILPNLDPAINGAYASTEANLQAAYATANSAAAIIAGSTIGSQVKTIVDAINNVVVTKDGNVYGYTNVYLEGDRVFGRTQEVNLGNITADANALKARAALGLGIGDAVFSLKNGGGIRASLGSVLANGTKVAPIANPLTGKPAGGISQLDVENALRFDNKLMVFDATPLGLKNILEFASGLSSGPTAQNGGYPQVGNIRFSYDSSQAAGSRLRSAALVNDAGQIVAKIVENGAVVPTAPATIKCVALSFTANGGDNYPIKYLNPPTNTNANNETSNFRLLLTNGTLSAPVDRSVDFTAAGTYASLGLTAADVLGEQKAFQDFLAARHPSLATAYNTADTAVAFDTRIQQKAFRLDTVLSGPFTYSGYLASGAANTDSDGLSLLEEFAYGLNPAVSDNVALNVNIPSGPLNSRGTPTIYSAPTAAGQDFRFVFVRLKNAASAGITYTPQFSNNMAEGSWENRAELPVTVIATDGDYEAVSVQYPFFTGGKKARFARMAVSTAP